VASRQQAKECPHLSNGGKVMGKMKLQLASSFLKAADRERGVCPSLARRLTGAAGPRCLSGALLQVGDQWASVGVFKTGASLVRTWNALFMALAR
jgi:hypothetical protein